jgi:hypothetical protein
MHSSLLDIERPVVEDRPVLENYPVEDHPVVEDRLEGGVAGDAVWTATGRERPVFFDEHGRRRRWVWLGGTAAGGASAFWLGALVAGAIGFSSMPAMQSGARLLASRPPHASVRAPASTHRKAVAHARSSSGPGGGGAELAVTRALIAER